LKKQELNEKRRLTGLAVLTNYIFTSLKGGSNIISSMGGIIFEIVSNLGRGEWKKSVGE